VFWYCYVLYSCIGIVTYCVVLVIVVY